MDARSEGTSKVSVVIPAYNAEAYLGETLASVASQTERDWLCVIVDDGSTDGTAAIASRFVEADGRFRLVQQANQGVASARNHGLRVSNCEFLLFLDADDLLECDAIERLKGILVDTPCSPAVHGRAAVIDHRGVPSDFRGYEQTHGRLTIRSRRFPVSAVPRVARLADTSPTGIDVLLLRNPITTPGQVLIRRSALDITGGFDLAAPPAEDWDMWIRLAQLGSFAYLPRVVIKYRSHDGGASAQLPRMRAAELLVRHKAIRSQPLVVPSGPTDDRIAARTRQLARWGLRYAEFVRATQRSTLAVRNVAGANVREAGRNLLRTGSSLYQVVLSFVPRWSSRTL